MFTLIIDRLLAELDGRYSSYQDVQKWFIFYNTFVSMSVEEICTLALWLQETYHMDFVDDANSFGEFICSQKTNASALQLSN